MSSVVDPRTLLQWVLVEQEQRARRKKAEEGPRWDWYGPDCGCNNSVRREDGSCPQHPRARDKQRPPEGDWLVWLILAGRGWGKTKTGAQWLITKAEALPGVGRFALVGQQASDVRDIMVEGQSGVMACSPPWFRPKYYPSKRKLEWPNGAIGLCYSAEEPDQFRGPQFHDAWCDELAKWPTPDEAWNNLQMGLRLGADLVIDGRPYTPQSCVTTTPVPIPIIKRLVKSPDTAVVKGSTYENVANLARSFIANIKAKYEGTRLGRQELHAEVLDDNPHALWSSELLDECRIAPQGLPDFVRVAVALDPSVNDPEKVMDEDAAAEAGVTVGGLDDEGRGYLLEDCSLRAGPTEWARVAVAAYHRHHADCVVAEANQGGAMIEALIRTIDPTINVILVHASRGKHTRAEPVAALFEQRKVSLVGNFPELEEQLTTWMPGMQSPDRLDSMVWLFTELMLNGLPLEAGESPWGDWRGS